jgi:predicted nucleic acid-binding protein
LILLDANALVALLRGEPAGPEVKELLRGGDCAIPASCVSEVVDIMLRVEAVDPGRLSERLGALLDESVVVLKLGPEVAWSAGRIRAAHYDRSRADLSLADCLLLAASGPEDEIASSGRAVVATAAKLGIATIALPDSRGERPSV